MTHGKFFFFDKKPVGYICNLHVAHIAIMQLDLVSLSDPENRGYS